MGTFKSLKKTYGEAAKAAGLPGVTPHTLRHTAASAPIWVATAALFLISLIFAPDSVRHSALLGMLPFAAVLAIAAMGQTLVVQQGGIDLSVPGMISLTIVLLTSYPNGSSGKLASAIVIAFAATLAAGAVSGVGGRFSALRTRAGLRAR